MVTKLHMYLMMSFYIPIKSRIGIYQEAFWTVSNWVSKDICLCFGFGLLGFLIG